MKHYSVVLHSVWNVSAGLLPLEGEGICKAGRPVKYEALHQLRFVRLGITKEALLRSASFVLALQKKPYCAPLRSSWHYKRSPTTLRFVRLGIIMANCPRAPTAGPPSRMSKKT